MKKMHFMLISFVSILSINLLGVKSRLTPRTISQIQIQSQKNHLLKEYSELFNTFQEEVDDHHEKWEDILESMEEFLPDEQAAISQLYTEYINDIDNFSSKIQAIISLIEELNQANKSETEFGISELDWARKHYQQKAEEHFDQANALTRQATYRIINQFNN